MAHRMVSFDTKVASQSLRELPGRALSPAFHDQPVILTARACIGKQDV